MRNEKSSFPVSCFKSSNLAAGLPETEEESFWFKQLVQIEKDLGQSNRTYMELSSEEETLVRQIAATNTLASMDARVMLYTAFGEEIILALPQLPSIIAENIGNWNVHFKNKNIVKDPKVIVYPNPTTDILSIQYFPEKNIDYKLQIFNSQGNLQMESSLDNKKSVFTLDIGNWSSGLYYYHIKGNSNMPNVGKFTIISK
ncbi:MAG: T9SS type A sorting domain-containing protein [Sphingobacteriales bacterium]|nr:MAG: T9SS type A sorting domain-containing protein [Sphingobacteriales bacterium]